jgi:hypothetical protein
MESDAKKILRTASLSLLFIFIVVYAFFRSSDLIFGVKIKEVTMGGLPAEASIKFTESVIKVSGNAKNATNVSLNGREISIDQTGNFSEDIALLVGYNIVNIEAKDKFGHIDELNYKLIYKK